MMKKFLTTIIAFCALHFALGQTPQWIQSAYREATYPSSQWYTGYSREKLRQGETPANALKRLQKDAQSSLAESIIVNIEGATENRTFSSRVQIAGESGEVITNDYQQIIRSSTSATTVKSEMKTYHDPATGFVYAFAAVKASDLNAYYTKQINLDLNKVDVALGMVEQLVAAGKKMSARRQVETAMKTLQGVVYMQDLLAAVNPNSNDDLLQIYRSNDLTSTVNQAIIDLEQSTAVFVECRPLWNTGKGDNAGDPDIVCNMVEQLLTENDCRITDDRNEADYVLLLQPSSTCRSDGSGQYGIISYYANCKGELTNKLTNKKTANFSIFNDSECYMAGKSADVAANKAFNMPELKAKILGFILPKIKN
ncbi:hypothetical protein FACS1894178_7650 [Bacteroidia bacterium]|nr:hypothetical protein FACS1894178_7650 [Bacteroidia bacterium]